MDFEKNLKELENIAEKMSTGQMGLTEAIKTFKKGMSLVRQCQKDLGQAEQIVEKLARIQEDGAPGTEPFFESPETAAAKTFGAQGAKGKSEKKSPAGKRQNESRPKKQPPEKKAKKETPKESPPKNNPQQDLF